MVMSRETFLAVASIFSVVLFFGLFYFLTGRRVLNRLISHMPVSKESGEFISYKLAGIMMTGAIPFIIFISATGMPLSEIGFQTRNIDRIGYLVGGLILLAVVSAYFSAKSTNVQRSAPELRIKVWRPRHIILSSAVWIIYLFGYELFFRGILWFLCCNAFGFVWALIINVTLYSLVHVPKGKLVTCGAIPLGTLFCTLSYYSGSFLPAFLIHTAMAVSTELFSVFHNPEFRFGRKGLAE
jgi:membrane protease YdiL (CAAX protease family)